MSPAPLAAATAQPYLTSREVAAMLDVSTDTIYRAIKADEITAIRVGRSLRITAASAQAYQQATRPAGPGLLTLSQAAALARVNVSTICRWATVGKLHRVPWGKRHRYRRHEVAALARSGRADQ